MLNPDLAQDERFSVRHTPGMNDWTLAIKFVSVRDQGVYVCQVNIFSNQLLLVKQLDGKRLGKE